MNESHCTRRARPASPETLAVRTRFARNIRLWAEERGISLNLLADRSGVSRAQMYNVLSGASSPSLDWIARIAPALGLEAWQLLVSPEIPRYAPIDNSVAPAHFGWHP